MPWKVFHKPALQVRELKLYKRKDKTYIHLPPLRTWLGRNQKNKMLHQDTSILFELITRHATEALWTRYWKVKQRVLPLVLLEQVGQQREARYTSPHMLNHTWRKLYFCEVRSWQHLNHISLNGSSSRAVNKPSEMFHHLFALLPHSCRVFFKILPKHT